jgi:hypothetical protein
MAVTGPMSPPSTMKIEKIWMPPPIIHIMKHMKPTCLNGDDASDHSACAVCVCVCVCVCGWWWWWWWWWGVAQEQGGVWLAVVGWPGTPCACAQGMHALEGDGGRATGAVLRAL